VTAVDSAHDYLDELVNWASSSLTGREVLLANLDGETSDFVRFNGATVRQAGAVTQRDLSIDLIEGSRHARGYVSLAQDLEIDRPRVSALIDTLREQRSAAPDDPYLLYSTEVSDSQTVSAGTMPAPSDAVGLVVDGAAGRDLVGVYAAGTTFSGFANSLGQRNWFQSSTFNLDWSLHLRADKATKNLYAGREWSDSEFRSKIDWSIRQLETLERQPVDLAPGGYRTFLAPSAIQEIIDMLSWGGFGLKSQRTKQTPLLRMITEGASFDPAIRISEDIAGGVAPDFQSDGFRRPDEVVLIDGGHLADSLVSPRSAREYDVPTNGAANHESPLSVAMAPGTLPTADAISELGTGLYVGNLWYLNFSDRGACRTTGMTRFSTFWVESGEIVAPVNVLRFDDTAFHLFGDRLVGLTDTAETILDSSSYGARSTSSYRLPGALVEEMTFTL